MFFHDRQFYVFELALKNHMAYSDSMQKYKNEDFEKDNFLV